MSEACLERTKDGIASVETINDVLLVSFSSGGIREERQILQVLAELGPYVEAHPGCNLVIDMEKIEYLSSAGLRGLVGILKKSHKGNGNLKLSRMQDAIVELFDVMRLTKIFEIFDDPQAAIDSFS
jgi:anti-anti-sigma factor